MKGVKNVDKLEKIKILLVGLILFVCACPGSAWAGTSQQGEVYRITLREAINLTWANNLELKLLEKEIGTRELDLDRAEFYRQKLIDADEKISDGWDEYRKARSDLDTLKSLIDRGIIGTDSDLYLTPKQIEEKEKALTGAAQELSNYSAYRVDNYDNAKVVDLYHAQAALGLNVTQIGVEQAYQQYALLTRQNYYEVLKQQRIVGVKRAAAQRGKSQYQLAKDSFEAGFRAKDDMLMAKAQLDLLQADLENGHKDLSLAEIALKKVIGLSPETEVILLDDYTAEQEITPLEIGLAQALENRLEIKKGEMELEVSRINMELAKRYTSPHTFDYRQSQMDLDQANLTLENAKQSVKSSVYGSYQTFLAAEKMLNQVKDSVKEAEEALNIVTFRYQEGYGIPSAALKSLTMEDAAGTVFEVLAAQEKLSEVEEKVVEITYGYHMAKSKYETDICGDEKIIRQPEGEREHE
ncbi:TolC family protein [Dehalobacterium formicoaceticum]|uniref:TolC family protein n=1 Tax=Dehalobacterium formicoaceticum TaxID=51515 RepID=A0ABT1Y3B6_9FIRM|nr:TolC family protein [Dehalobacterium formicoaceticum]